MRALTNEENYGIIINLSLVQYIKEDCCINRKEIDGLKNGLTKDLIDTCFIYLINFYFDKDRFISWKFKRFESRRSVISGIYASADKYLVV